eukprot:GHRR01016909.1.p1 GENE.GHRR01016909.1~~GHRR01016909.1.p1  ORF type:complete len:499 (+),score=158.17 GHRR01016909.1:358-1854(+)
MFGRAVSRNQGPLAAAGRAYSRSRSQMLPSTQLSEYAQRQLGPDVIDFAAGQPGLPLLPLHLIAAGATDRFTGPKADPFILQYGPEQGYTSFRQCLADFLTHSTQHPVDPEELIITAGVSHGLDMACRHLARPGDVVLVEAPTYFLAGSILRQAGLKLVPVLTGEDGIDVDALDAFLQQPDAPRPKLLYTIPIHNNPAGTTIPLHKRQQLIRLAHRYGFTVIADEVYQLLSFPDAPSPPPPMKEVERQLIQRSRLSGPILNNARRISETAAAEQDGATSGSNSSNGGSSERHDDSNNMILNDGGSSQQQPPEGRISCSASGSGIRSSVVSLGSFSKIMAPGLRLGWMEASPPLLQALRADGVLGSGGSIAPLASGIAHSCLQMGLLQQQLQEVVRPRLQQNCTALCKTLQRELPQCRFHQPQGGYFVWLELPKQVCSGELLKLATQRHKVGFVPGRACHGAPHMARFSFSFYEAHELQEGVQRFAAALREYLDGARPT